MEAEAGSAIAQRVAILYKRNAEPDAQILAMLEEALRNEGIDVFIDRHLEVGVEWAKHIEEQIREADAVIPLISEAAIHSEMLGFEIGHANDVAEATNGRPSILPVRVDYTGPLPDPLAGVLDPLQYILWDGEYATEGLIAELLYSLQRLPEPQPVTEVIPEKGERLTSKLAPQQPVKPVGGPAPGLCLEPAEFSFARSLVGSRSRPRCHHRAVDHGRSAHGGNLPDGRDDRVGISQGGPRSDCGSAARRIHLECRVESRSPDGGDRFNG